MPCKHVGQTSNQNLVETLQGDTETFPSLLEAKSHLLPHTEKLAIIKNFSHKLTKTTLLPATVFVYYGVPLFMLITKSNPDRMKYANFEVKILSSSFENYRSSDGCLVVLTTGSIFANLRMKYHVNIHL